MALSDRERANLSGDRVVQPGMTLGSREPSDRDVNNRDRVAIHNLWVAPSYLIPD
jgi:hypothetical protein